MLSPLIPLSRVCCAARLVLCLGIVSRELFARGFADAGRGALCVGAVLACWINHKPYRYIRSNIAVSGARIQGIVTHLYDFDDGCYGALLQKS